MPPSFLRGTLTESFSFFKGLSLPDPPEYLFAQDHTISSDDAGQSDVIDKKDHIAHQQQEKHAEFSQRSHILQDVLDAEQVDDDQIV